MGVTACIGSCGDSQRISNSTAVRVCDLAGGSDLAEGDDHTLCDIAFKYHIAYPDAFYLLLAVDLYRQTIFECSAYSALTEYGLENVSIHGLDESHRECAGLLGLSIQNHISTPSLYGLGGDAHVVLEAFVRAVTLIDEIAAQSGDRIGGQCSCKGRSENGTADFGLAGCYLSCVIVCHIYHSS